MPRPAIATPRAVLYRAALWLCPPAFRREFAAQMLQDFAEARSESRASGRPGDRWRFRARMALDLTRTIAAQWTRSPLPYIAGVAAVVSVVVAGVVADVVLRLRIDAAVELDDADVVGLVLVATTVVMLVSSTIILTLWAARPARRVGRR
jgi:hypothetical protein